MTTERCRVCDAVLATSADYERFDDIAGESDPCNAWAKELCWRAFDCTCKRAPVDWRARCLRVEAELARVKPVLDAADSLLAADATGGELFFREMAIELCVVMRVYRGFGKP